MKQKVWILNHYAGGTLFDKGGRHYWIAKYLKKAGYDPVVFVSNSRNGAKERFIDTSEKWTEKIAEDIDTPYVFVKAKLYSGNGKDRVLNMYQYYKNVQYAAKQYAKTQGKPDVIYASSVHPLTLIAGLKLAKKYRVKCICEIRDLWPESLVAYGHLKRKSVLAKIMYGFEKRIYKKADSIVMTWPGGYDYIRDRGWSASIPPEKVVHISNGVDLTEYLERVQNDQYTDEELENTSVKKIIYAGSIREVNNLELIVKAAKLLQEQGIKGFKILIYGGGSDKERLEREVSTAGVNNIIFVGRVPKESVPAVLSHAYVTLLHNSSTELDKYGQSQNKFFEYLAAGKPVLMTYSVGHSICRKYKCGFEIEHQNAESIANAIAQIIALPEQDYLKYSYNARKTAEQFDFKNLTKKVIDVIESV